MAEISIKESPFTPGKPVEPEHFIARAEEVKRLQRAVQQTALGRNENIFITGERGIGKSSLASYTRYMAEKEYGLVGAYCSMGALRTLEAAVGTIFQRLLESCEKSVFERLKDAFHRYIRGITLPLGIGGIEFTDDKSDLQSLVSGFLPALHRFHEAAKEDGKKGVMVILDDLNGITGVPEFSHFLKSAVDGLATSRERFPLLFVLVGVSTRREDLVEHQPSVARIFDVVELRLMSSEESTQFFEMMFNKQMINVAADAMLMMNQFSAGYPMLMHEVGDAVFWQNNDSHIDLKDAKQGIVEAARSVGRKYIGAQVGSLFRNKTYSSILLRMGQELPIGATFKRQELLKEDAPEKERQNLDNFLTRVKKLGIMKDGEVRGEYTFVNPLYHLYLWYEAKAKNE